MVTMECRATGNPAPKVKWVRVVSLFYLYPLIVWGPEGKGRKFRNQVKLFICNVCTVKGMSLCHKLWFYNPYIFATRCCRPKIFQTMNCYRSNYLSLTLKMFTQSACKEIWIRKLEFVSKTQLVIDDLYIQILLNGEMIKILHPCAMYIIA